MASVQCIVPSGDLPLEIVWLLNLKPLIGIDGIAITKMGKRSSVLTIDFVTGKHAGNYTCQVTNNAATVNLTAALVVNGTITITFVFII